MAGLYCLVVLQYRVEKRDIRRAFVWGNAIFGAVFLFNQVFGTNYIMTDQLPDHILQMFPFLQYVNIPILWLELCAWPPSRWPISRSACCVGWTGTNGSFIRTEQL